MKQYAHVGICLLCVQQAEKALQSAIQTVLENESVKLLEQSEPERKQTLGDFLKKLKRRVKLPLHVKENLYTFLKMRNRLVHGFDFELRTEHGSEAAKLFLLELSLRALGTTGLVTALFQVWARDEHDTEFFEVEDEHTRQIIKTFEKQFGSMAREILAGRSKVPPQQ